MIAICSNPFRDRKFRLTLQAKKLLSDAGFDSYICPLFTEGEENIIPETLETKRLENIAGDCTLIIVIGGDGTILAAARKMGDCNVPILGVNLGTKGFMATLEPENLECITEAARGNMHISRRMRLSVSLIRRGEVIYTDSALNDAVIHGYGDCIKMDVACNGERIKIISGDGIVLSTPTGSTGYSMSAGGPIVEPDAENIIMSPICAHAMGSRSFVLGPQREVTVTLEKLHGRKAYLSVDGNSVIDLENGDILSVRRSENYTLMADMQLRSFYEIVCNKLT